MTHRYSNNSDKILACIPIDGYKKYVQHASRTLAFKSHLLLLEVFKVDVLEVLRQLTLYATIDIMKTNIIHKINKIEEQTEEYVQHASRTLAFKSRLLLLEVFEVDVLEVLR
jgi:hypothetical protein